MKKSLIALAALVVAGGAYAQSSVTITGNFKAGIASTKYNSVTGATQSGTGLSVADGSSRLIVGFNEDLGGGLRSIGQWDIRIRIDDNGGAGAAPTTAVASQLGTGNTFLGLRGGFGTFRVGKLDTHYCLGSDSHGVRATALQASSCGILGYVGAASNSIANASRTVNLIRYDLPQIGGFNGGIAYSTAFNSTEGLLGADKGSALNVNGSYAAGPVSVAASYWDAKNEAKTLIQKAATLTGTFNFGMGTVGLTYDVSHAGSLGAEAVRKAISVPLTFNVGAGAFLVTYTKASDLKRNTTVADSGATLLSVGYDYALSKRTSIGVSYAKLTNDRNASYALYTQQALNGHASGTNGGAPVAGQDQQQFYFGIRNAF
jgi:predicted porin